MSPRSVFLCAGLIVFAASFASAQIYYCQKICTADYRPVCALDIRTGAQTTYGNACQLRNAQCTNPFLVFLKNGECQTCPAFCPFIYKPVCGVNLITGQFQTYGNDCLLSIAQCKNALIQKIANTACPFDNPVNYFY